MKKYLVKHFLLSLAGILLLLACKTGKQNPSTSTSKKTFIPHAIGNYWVYESSLDQYRDTLKVTAHNQTAEGLKVDLTFERWLVKAEGDSIFIRCQNRGGGEFIMPLYIKGESTYTTCKGDVVMEVQAKKLPEPQVVKGNTYNNCYLFDIRPYTKVIVAEGIGVISYQYYDIDNKLNSERQLINYKLN